MLLAGLILGLAIASVAGANAIGPINFETSQGYVLGDINNQQGWTKSGPYDVAVADVSAFPAASGYGFGAQALRLSDAVTSGSFGDQTFSPAVSPAGESTLRLLDSSFRIGTALATVQAGLHTSVSPDDGNGSRMSYVRFEDQANGVHVFFIDATNPGPIGHETTFTETDIATLNRTSAHLIAFSLRFNPGPHNDTVKISVDGKKRITGTSWEDYYRYDAEQIGNGNVVAPISKMLFRESGTANAANLGNGFLVDGFSLSSTAVPGFSLAN